MQDNNIQLPDMEKATLIYNSDFDINSKHESLNELAENTQSYEMAVKFAKKYSERFSKTYKIVKLKLLSETEGKEDILDDDEEYIDSELGYLEFDAKGKLCILNRMSTKINLVYPIKKRGLNITISHSVIHLTGGIL